MTYDQIRAVAVTAIGCGVPIHELVSVARRYGGGYRLSQSEERDRPAMACEFFELCCVWSSGVAAAVRGLR